MMNKPKILVVSANAQNDASFLVAKIIGRIGCEVAHISASTTPSNYVASEGDRFVTDMSLIDDCDLYVQVCSLTEYAHMLGMYAFKQKKVILSYNSFCADGKPPQFVSRAPVAFPYEVSAAPGRFLRDKELWEIIQCCEQLLRKFKKSSSEGELHDGRKVRVLRAINVEASESGEEGSVTFIRDGYDEESYIGIWKNAIDISITRGLSSKTIKEKHDFEPREVAPGIEEKYWK